MYIPNDHKTFVSEKLYNGMEICITESAEEIKNHVFIDSIETTNEFLSFIIRKK